MTEDQDGSAAAIAAAASALGKVGGRSRSPKKRAASAANGRVFGGRPVASRIPADVAAQIRAQYPGLANANLRAKLRRIYLRDGALPTTVPTRRRKAK